MGQLERGAGSLGDLAVDVVVREDEHAREGIVLWAGRVGKRSLATGEIRLATRERTLALLEVARAREVSTDAEGACARALGKAGGGQRPCMKRGTTPGLRREDLQSRGDDGDGTRRDFGRQSRVPSRRGGFAWGFGGRRRGKELRDRGFCGHARRTRRLPERSRRTRRRLRRRPCRRRRTWRMARARGRTLRAWTARASPRASRAPPRGGRRGCRSRRRERRPSPGRWGPGTGCARTYPRTGYRPYFNQRRGRERRRRRLG